MAIEGCAPLCPFVKGKDKRNVTCDGDCTVPTLDRLFQEFAHEGVDIDFDAAQEIERRRCVLLRKQKTR